MDVAHQVCILYAVTRGYLETIPVDRVEAFSGALYRLLEDSHPEILQSIRLTEAITPENEAALQALLASFVQTFTQG